MTVRIRITEGFGWYKNHVGEEVDVLCIKHGDYVVWQSEHNNEDYDFVKQEHAEEIEEG